MTTTQLKSLKETMIEELIALGFKITDSSRIELITRWELTAISPVCGEIKASVYDHEAIYFRVENPKACSSISSDVMNKHSGKYNIHFATSYTSGRTSAGEMAYAKGRRQLRIREHLSPLGFCDCPEFA